MISRIHASHIAHEAAVNIVFQLKMGETVRARYTRLTSVCTEHQQINRPASQA